MNISEAIDFLNFWIAKEKGSYFTPEECIEVIDRGQMAFYNDIKPKYAVSQLVKDTLSPFRARYDFSPANTISGLITIPSNSNYLDLLDIQIEYQISNRTVYAAIPVVNEDTRADRLRSQIDPVTITSPIAEQYAPRVFRMYPTSGYTGTITYLRRPIKPVFAYNLISGRTIVYDAANSTQLEWRETEITPILLKGLSSLGINLSAADVSQFAEMKTQQNYQGVNNF